MVLFFWLLGFIFRFGGFLIHMLLIVAVLVFIVNVITGRKNKG
ncbi:lmo0937 family membrane protein [Clostridium pasteurianum]|nr:lmo0937 family membrane protein [Clostridium pasteurianum]UZW16250.1 lmo0937 family membrane protein [Clostridium pasteurianum]